MAVPIHLGKYMYIEDSDFTCMAASNKSHELFCEVMFALSMIPPQPRIFTFLPSLTKASLLKALKELTVYYIKRLKVKSLETAEKHRGISLEHI